MVVVLREPTRTPTRTDGRRLVLAASLAVIFVGLALRLLLLIRSSWLLEGDDALSALMALRVLDGDRPIMLKNQTYAAAWEPYAMAISYAAFGISRMSAKLPELLQSTALVGTSFLLGREAGGRAAGWFSATLFAVPPAYVLVMSLKPWAPYTEVILFGSLCLWCAMRLGWPRPGQRDGVWALGCGIAGGLAFWMHPLAVWYLSTAVIAVLVRVRGVRLLHVAGPGLLGFGFGALPVWIYNVVTDGATFRFVQSGSSGQTADRWTVLQAWWNNDLPRGAGLWHPWGPSPPAFGVLVTALLVVAVLAAVFVRDGWRLRPLDTVLVFLVLIPLVFVVSGFGGPALNPYGFDATGRYTPPIWSGLAVIGGWGLAQVWRVRRVFSVLLASVAVAIDAIGILAIDPLAAFQSPYWDRLPADSAPLLSALRDEGVQAVWLNHWAGQPLMFDAAAAGQPLVAYDWYDVQAGGIDRFPEYLRQVRHAQRPAFVLVTDEAEPALEQTLRLMGTSFVERRVWPYVVVIPNSREVDPSEVTDALDYRY